MRLFCFYFKEFDELCCQCFTAASALRHHYGTTVLARCDMRVPVARRRQTNQPTPKSKIKSPTSTQRPGALTPKTGKNDQNKSTQSGGSSTWARPRASLKRSGGVGGGESPKTPKSTTYDAAILRDLGRRPRHKRRAITETHLPELTFLNSEHAVQRRKFEHRNLVDIAEVCTKKVRGGRGKGTRGRSEWVDVEREVPMRQTFGPLSW